MKAEIIIFVASLIVAGAFATGCTPTCPAADFTIPSFIQCNQPFVAALNVACGCDFELTNGDICQLVNGEPFACLPCERINNGGVIRSMSCIAAEAGPHIILGAYLPDQIGCPVNKTFTVTCC
jgi:hypothetical protein